MNLKSVDWKRVYTTSEDDLINDFFKPALKNSIRYDRGVGFFSSSWIQEAAEGLAEFACNDGKARWITSPILDKKDWEALLKGSEAENDKALSTFMVNNVNVLKEKITRERLSALAWMVSDGILDFKLACPRHKLCGDFHSKFGVFYDENGDKIGFNGSYNDSHHGLTNDETISVYPGWVQVLEEFTANYEKRFEKLWNNQDGNVKVYDLPNAAKSGILQLRQYSRPYPPPKSITEKIEVTRKENQRNRFCFPINFDLREYQKKAIQNWKSAGYKGIFAMATGSGKTLTSLWAAKLVADKCESLAVIVVCPTKNLASQWVKEINSLGMECVECFDRRKAVLWEEELLREYSALFLNSKDVLMVVVSNKTFTSQNFQSRLKTEKIPHLLIADEVHNLGAESISDSLNQGIQLRIGLSATPRRHFDDSGTKVLFDYFGEPVYEYSLGDAIREGHLTRYYYYPILVDLTEQETDEYWEITQQLSKYYSKDTDGKLPSFVENLLIRRARLLTGAQNKMQTLRSEIQNLGLKNLKFEKALVYCGDVNSIDPRFDEPLRNIDQVCELLYELNYKVKKITCDESREERDYAVELLKTGNIDALVAIRCMDEGIDIPDARIGFITASSTNPRQFVQRRGRLLRKAKGKDFAHIFDFVIMPPDLSPYCRDENVYRKVERNFFKRELDRIDEFCSDAYNGPVASSIFNKLKDKFNLFGYE